jgi:hypothetical protein
MIDVGGCEMWRIIVCKKETKRYVSGPKKTASDAAGNEE